MELDSFLASPRWDILQIISEHPYSPIEIAEKTKTTVSFVSQQLKLLEAAGLVKKEKTGAFEKGKPRTLFSISQDYLYLIILTNGFAKKKLIELSDYRKTLLKIWLIENKNLHGALEEFIEKIKKVFSEIDALLLDFSKDPPKIILFSENKKLKPSLEVSAGKLNPKFNLDLFSITDFNLSELDFSKIHILHANNIFLKKKTEMKGGKKENEKTNN